MFFVQSKPCSKNGDIKVRGGTDTEHHEGPNPGLNRLFGRLRRGKGRKVFNKITRRSIVWGRLLGPSSERGRHFPTVGERIDFFSIKRKRIPKEEKIERP